MSHRFQRPVYPHEDNRRYGAEQYSRELAETEQTWPLTSLERKEVLSELCHRRGGYDFFGAEPKMLQSV